MQATMNITRALDPIPERELSRHIKACAPRDRLARLPISRFEPISLDELGRAALMDRVDTKFVLRADAVAGILSQLDGHYRMLEVEGVRQSRYRTVYYDTAARDMYHSHHRGRSVRHKVRTRQYVDSGIEFLEVKRRTNKGRTVKTRLLTQAPGRGMSSAGAEFVGQHAPYDPAELRPALVNTFRRMTLVAHNRQERVTFDLGLVMWTDSACVSLLPIAVAEIKQSALDRRSPGYAAIRSTAALPTSFSKYCIGTAVLCPEIKQARFRPLVRMIDHMMRSESNAERSFGPGNGSLAESIGCRVDRQVHLLPTHT